MIDLDAPPASATKQVISTGGPFRVDEMALTTDGKLLLAANNADDPAFVTLFAANGDSSTSAVTIIQKTFVDPTVMPIGFGLSIENPDRTRRRSVSTRRSRSSPTTRLDAITASSRREPAHLAAAACW